MCAAEGGAWEGHHRQLQGATARTEGSESREPERLGRSARAPRGSPRELEARCRTARSPARRVFQPRRAKGRLESTLRAQLNNVHAENLHLDTDTRSRLSSN